MASADPIAPPASGVALLDRAGDGLAAGPVEPPAPRQEPATPDPQRIRSGERWSCPVSMNLARFGNDTADPHILRGMD